MRKFNRKKDQIRDLTIETNVNKNSDGSCIIRLGDTHVICTASFENDVPQWLKNRDSGWITAEYGMLPASTSSRNKREAAREKGKSDRISQANTQQSKLIEQRKRNLPAIKFESNEDSLDGFDLAEFGPK